MATEYLSTLESLPSTTAPTKPPITGTARVDLTRRLGPPQHLASGFIYGIPDTPNQIPPHFYKDIHFRYSRAGGSQLPSNRGWARSEADYAARFASMQSNYATTRQHDGQFILLISDLWGADGGQPKNALWPGDPLPAPSEDAIPGTTHQTAEPETPDWTHWDALLQRWLADTLVQPGNTREDLAAGLIFDIWNEPGKSFGKPDLHFFWKRSPTRWLQLWSHTYTFLRTHCPHIRITGPSLSAAPSRSNPWWTAFLTHVARTGEVPDQWAWHMEEGHASVTVSTAVTAFRDMLRERAGLEAQVDTKEINLNEYATFAEQLPSGGAWWIAQLERAGCLGLRGNWAMGGALHDFMGGLVGKEGGRKEGEGYLREGGDYWAAAEWWVYWYYASVMSGEKVGCVATEVVEGEEVGGGRELGDVYAVLDGEGKVLRVLAGARVRPGRWGIEVGELERKEGTVKVRAIEFRGDEKDHLRKFDQPKAGPEWEVQIKDGKIVLPVEHDDAATAFAFEITL